MENIYTIGELAKEMNVSVRTLQHYDRIGLLQPSSYSSGGRRLYTIQDKLRLHQILSLKKLGFTLTDIKSKIFPMNTPEEILGLMDQQMKLLKEKIADYQLALTTMDKMKTEIQKIGEVNFQKYADIISIIENHNDNYWIVGCFDDDIMHHLRENFKDQPKEADLIYETYVKLLDKAIGYQKENVPVDSTQAKKLAQEWWDMVMDFTKGDMSLLPKLMQFNQDKSKWEKELASKQREVDGYIENILNSYFQDKEMQQEEDNT